MEIELIYSLLNKDGVPCRGHQTRCEVLSRAFKNIVPDLQELTDYTLDRYYDIIVLADGDYSDTKITVVDEPTRKRIPGHYGRHIIVRVVDDWIKWTQNNWFRSGEYYLYPIPDNGTGKNSPSSFVYTIIDTPDVRKNINILLVPGSNHEVFMAQVLDTLPIQIGGAYLNYEIALGRTKEEYNKSLANADIVIASCSNNALEALAIGCNVMTVLTSDDQAQLSVALERRGVKRYNEKHICDFMESSYGIRDESELFVKDLLKKCNL